MNSETHRRRRPTTQNAPPWNAGIWISCFLTSVQVAMILFAAKTFGTLVIRGKKHITSLDSLKNVLIVSNHPSFADAYLVNATAFFPDMLFRSKTHFPWQVSDAEKTKAFFWYRWGRFVDIHRDRRDAAAYRRMISLLPQGTMVFFPEGKRSHNVADTLITTKSGIRIGRPQPGVGGLIFHANPVIIPAFVTGMERVWPAGQRIPRLASAPITIAFGPPTTCKALLSDCGLGTPPADKIPRKVLFQLLADRVMLAVANLDT